MLKWLVTAGTKFTKLRDRFLAHPCRRKDSGKVVEFKIQGFQVPLFLSLPSSKKQSFNGAKWDEAVADSGKEMPSELFKFAHS